MTAGGASALPRFARTRRRALRQRSKQAPGALPETILSARPGVMPDVRRHRVLPCGFREPRPAVALTGRPLGAPALVPRGLDLVTRSRRRLLVACTRKPAARAYRRPLRRESRSPDRPVR